MRDIERGAPVEADHILGDLLRRGGANGRAGSLLDIAFRHVKAYEERRARNQAEAPKAA
jgi:2-dehydropantoate 2-reductase